MMMMKFASAMMTPISGESIRVLGRTVRVATLLRGIRARQIVAVRMTKPNGGEALGRGQGAHSAIRANMRNPVVPCLTLK